MVILNTHVSGVGYSFLLTSAFKMFKLTKAKLNSANVIQMALKWLFFAETSKKIILHAPFCDTLNSNQFAQCAA